MKPSCYNRPPFKSEITVSAGWNLAGGRITTVIPDPMSKGCQQHGPLGEATLHPDDWDCVGCEWIPNKESK